MIKQSKNSLRKTASGSILLTVVLPWLLTRSGLAAEKFKVTLIGREETATLERQNDQFSEITSVDADEEGHIYVLSPAPRRLALGVLKLRQEIHIQPPSAELGGLT